MRRHAGAPGGDGGQAAPRHKCLVETAVTWISVWLGVEAVADALTLVGELAAHAVPERDRQFCLGTGTRHRRQHAGGSQMLRRRRRDACSYRFIEELPCCFQTAVPKPSERSGHTPRRGIPRARAGGPGPAASGRGWWRSANSHDRAPCDARVPGIGEIFLGGSFVRRVRQQQKFAGRCVAFRPRPSVPRRFRTRDRFADRACASLARPPSPGPFAKVGEANAGLLGPGAGRMKLPSAARGLLPIPPFIVRHAAIRNMPAEASATRPSPSRAFAVARSSSMVTSRSVPARIARSRKAPGTGGLRQRVADGYCK